MFIWRVFVAFLQEKHYKDLLVMTLVTLFIGGVVYHYVEGWSWLDSFYFSIITLTTIGYGDLCPQTTWGKVFTIFYILVGVGLTMSFITTFYEHYHTTIRKRYPKREK